MRITKEKFNEYMAEICMYYNKQEEFVDDVEKIFPNSFERIYDTSSLEFTIDMLSETIDDKHKWISHYVIENKCKGFSWWDVDEVEHKCETYDDLWELIQGDKND